MTDGAIAYHCGVLTISTGCAEGWREDTSGLVAQEVLSASDFSVSATAIVADDIIAIQEVLVHWSDVLELPLIVTSGGTGLTPNDLTPEATRPLLQRDVPGMAEAMRMGTLAKTPMAMLSRGVTGVRGRSLILNLPGSPKGVRECLEVVLPVLHHAIALLRQEQTSH